MPLFTLSSLTCHRFVITSIAVSSKGLCDAFCPNNLYARVGGISLSELNVLEREFLQMIDWRLMVSSIFSLSTSGLCPSAPCVQEFFVSCGRPLSFLHGSARARPCRNTTSTSSARTAGISSISLAPTLRTAPQTAMMWTWTAEAPPRLQFHSNPSPLPFFWSTEVVQHYSRKSRSGQQSSKTWPSLLSNSLRIFLKSVDSNTLGGHNHALSYLPFAHAHPEEIEAVKK